MAEHGLRMVTRDKTYGGEMPPFKIKIKMKPTKQEYVSWIAERLLTIPVDRKAMISEFCGLFRVTERTFDAYWKIATEEHRERLKAKQKALDESLATETSEAIKRNIMSKNDALEVLTRIAKGIARKIGTEIIIPTCSDQRAAIETMAKFEGWITKEGETDKPITININTDNVSLESDDI